MSDTRENNKRVAKNTIFLYFRMFLTMAISLYTSRVILEALGIENYGIYNVVGGVVSMMGILNSAMSVSTQRYLTFEIGTGNKVRLKQIFSTCFLIYIILSVLIIILGETIGLWFVNNKLVIPEDRMVAANWVYQFSLISCVNYIFSIPYNAVIIAREKMNIYAYISIISVLLKLIIVYVLLISPFDKLITFGLLLLIVDLMTTMFYRIYCIRNFAESRFYFYWDPKLFKQLLSYSGWNLFGSFSGIAKGEGLNILLNTSFGPIVNASRGISYQINTAISQFFSNFYTAVRPQITKYYAKDEMDNMFSLVFRSSKFAFYLIMLISLPILIETPFIINLWLGQLPEYTVEFTRLIIIISTIDSMATPLMTTAHATGKIKLYQSVVGTLIILNLPISYCLLKYGNFGPTIVFVVSLFLSIVSFFVRLWIVKRLVNFPVWRFIKDVLFRVIFIAIISAIIPIFAYNSIAVSFASFCLITAICIVSFVGSIYIFGLTKGEKAFLIQTVKNKIIR